MTQGSAPLPAKPLLRGWFHAGAAVLSVGATVGLLLRTRNDLVRLLSLLAFGLSMVELYTVSAIYHIGHWQGRTRTVLRSLDHANIFVLIAGTYTPICVNVLTGWLRTTMLAIVWSLAAIGAAGSVFTLRFPRWLSSGLYIAMGWVSLISAPALARLLPRRALGLLLGGGVLYTVGAVTYATRKPNPFPRVFGYHEIFHLFVIAGGASFLVAVWRWVVPFPRR
ncbi:MAG TPA: hemolysin III family protein [Chloroflexota bacterium]|nr:hemolysin III family protein [Chloroflexota bacterium]